MILPGQTRAYRDDARAPRKADAIQGPATPLHDMLAREMALTRFGVAMDSALLAQFDHLVEERRTTRSEDSPGFVRGRDHSVALVDARRRLRERDARLRPPCPGALRAHRRNPARARRPGALRDACPPRHGAVPRSHRDARDRADKLQKAAEAIFATRGVNAGRRRDRRGDGPRAHARAEAFARGP